MQIYGKLILNGTYFGGIKLDANILLLILRGFPYTSAMFGLVI